MNREKWLKFARGAAIAAAGAVLAYASSVVVPSLEGAGLVTVAMVASSLVNLAKLMLSKVSSNE